MRTATKDLAGDLRKQLAELVRSRVPNARAEQFVQRFYANVPPDDLLRATPEQLYGAALAMWQWGQHRRPGSARVRVYSPRLDEHGWQSDRTVVEIVNDDMPFLVDSVTAELNRQGVTVHLVIHPVVRVRRDADGKLDSLLEPGVAQEGAHDESFMHCSIDPQSDPAVLARLREGLERVLSDVRAAVQDWGPMRVRVAGSQHDLSKAPDPAEAAEAADFMGWVDAGNVTLLGSRYYKVTQGHPAQPDDPWLELVEGSGLGVLRDPETTVFDEHGHAATLPAEIRAFLHQPRPLLVTKGTRLATVHRAVPLDALLVKRFDEEGRVFGVLLMVGLFTSVAYNRSPREIPFLRRKIADVMARAGFDPQGHDGKALLNILETYPRDELFQIQAAELYETAIGILYLQERQRLALFVRPDPFERFVSCLVYVPRDRYDTTLRRKFQAILEAGFKGVCTSYYTQLSESALARLHLIIRTEPGQTPAFDVAELETRLVQAARGWSDHLRDALIDAHGEEIGNARLRRYADAFPAGYREDFTAEAAVHDIERIEQATAQQRLGITLFHPLEAEEDELHVKLYHLGRPIPLSDVLPMLEHMDLKVITEQPYEVTAAGADAPVWIHDFAARSQTGAAVDTAQVKEIFQDAFAAVWSGRMEDDGFNRLILRAGLTARDVVVLRAYAKFLKQARFAYAQDTVEATLASHPEIARLIARLFAARFDPKLRQGTGADEAPILEAIDSALDAVTNLDDDRILRRFVTLVRATLRTNAY
ncbi:NAD-glutamate dehydrogenase domain-containing protein, partial [Azospirillum griseum]